MSTALNRPNLIARLVMLLALGLAVLGGVLLLGGGSSYVLNLQMSNASGLRPGSQVLLGGVSVGTVHSLNLNSHNVVVADLHLNRGQVRVGRGASASIVAANLLGEKYVSLKPGDASAPLPSGTTLPESTTAMPTDLDQIVAVLDDPTRVDLATLLSEAGTAVAGRRADVGAILRQFPLSLDAATKLLTTMVQDNHTLGDLVANSNQFITRINAQRGDLKRVIDASAGAVTTLALNASQLQRTVVGLPGVARTFTNTFIEGRQAILPLIPAVKEIVTSAPELDALLRAVKPFTKAAVPTLNRAAAVAPTLEQLASQGTPIVKLAVPTLSSLENIARLAGPLSAWAGLSSHDIFNIFAGWTRAIQFRDGLSHIFNGDVYLSPAIVLNAANLGASPAQRRQNLLDIKSPDLLRTLGLLGKVNAMRAADAARKSSGSAKRTAARTGTSATSAASSGAATGAAPPAGAGAATQSSAAAAGASAGAGSPPSGGSDAGAGAPLHQLLNFLLGI